MTIQYVCEQCDASLKIKDELAGSKGKCPKCKQPFTVPFSTSEDSIADFLGSGEEDGPPPVPPIPQPAASAVPETASQPAARSAVEEADAEEVEPAGQPATNQQPAENSFVSAGSAANELLSMTGRKAQKFDSYEGDPDRPDDAIDFVGTFRYFAVRIAPVAAVMFIVIFGTYYISQTVMTTEPERPDLGFVTGIVTLDDKPLANVTVMFQPEKWSASVGTTDESGRYSLYYVQEVKGAALGKHRVEIQAGSDKEAVPVPPNYNIMSELTADVKAGSNEFNWSLKSN